MDDSNSQTSASGYFFSLADYQNHSHFANLRALISNPGQALSQCRRAKKARGGGGVDTSLLILNGYLPPKEVMVFMV